MPSSSDLRSELKVAGLRVTIQRLAVLEVLRERRLHLSVEQVIEATKARLLTVSVQAVYDALSALCGAGLARRIEPAGSVALSCVRDRRRRRLRDRLGSVPQAVVDSERIRDRRGRSHLLGDLRQLPTARLTNKNSIKEGV